MSDDGEGPELKRRIRDQALTLVQGIPRRRAEQAETERALVHNARQAGITWDEIAKAAGMSAGWRPRALYGEPEPESEQWSFATMPTTTAPSGTTLVTPALAELLRELHGGELPARFRVAGEPEGETDLSGDVTQQPPETQAITVRLPKDLYERLRLEAFEKRTSQAAIITEALSQRYSRTRTVRGDEHSGVQVLAACKNCGATIERCREGCNWSGWFHADRLGEANAAHYCAGANGSQAEPASTEGEPDGT